MAFKTYKGWYTITQPTKFIPPQDDYMGSFNESTMQVEYKSGLELKSFLYCDRSSTIKLWSVEPFPIPYIKPTDEMLHRYFPDLLIEFESGKKVLVEVKPSSQTREPVKPKKSNKNSIRRYKREVVTWEINQAKWEAAKEFCAELGITFMFLTERQLDKIKL